MGQDYKNPEWTGDKSNTLCGQHYRETSIARTPIDTSQHLSKNRWDNDCTSGYVFTLRGVIVYCNSSKQTVITKTVIARSMMESEFIALDKA